MSGESLAHFPPPNSAMGSFGPSLPRNFGPEHNASSMLPSSVNWMSNFSTAAVNSLPQQHATPPPLAIANSPSVAVDGKHHSTAHQNSCSGTHQLQHPLLLDIGTAAENVGDSGSSSNNGSGSGGNDGGCSASAMVGFGIKTGPKMVFTNFISKKSVINVRLSQKN